MERELKPSHGAWLLLQTAAFYKTKPSPRLRLSDENPEDRISPEEPSVCFVSLDCLVEKAPEISVRNL
jgi:hypothetical protein